MKGDVETVFSRCTFAECLGTVQPILEDGRSSVAAVVDEMLEDGMKVIAVARKDLGNQNTVALTDEANMILLGYLAFFDAPKKSAAQSIAELKDLQIKTKILTGDHQQVTLSVCSRIGIASEDMLTGADVNRLPDLELQHAVEKTDVFSELTPSQKAVS